MIKDIIVSYKLSNLHFRQLAIYRIESEEDNEVLRYQYLSKFLNENELEIEEVDQVMSVFQSMTEDNFESYYPVMNYLNLYVDVYDRLDLLTLTEVEDFPVKMYLSTKDNGAFAMASDDPDSSHISDCVMNFFLHKMAMNPNLVDIVKLQFQIDTYSALAAVGSGGDFDASRFYNFITSGDKLFRIYVK